MPIFINVLEEIIVKEVRIQIEELRPEMQPKVKVAEVVAYALNRLPPLFATSMIGWKYQYDYALNELHPQIAQTIKHGIKAILFGDPLHDTTPLPKHLFLNSAGVLHQLNQLLKRKYLRWRDVPVIVKEMSDKCSQFSQINNFEDQTIIQGLEETRLQDVNHLNRQHRAVLSSSKRFMQKQLVQKQEEAFRLELEKAWDSHIKSCEGSWSSDKRAKDALEMEYRALESYTLEAQLGLINVLEHLVFLVIEKATPPELNQQFNKSEVAAYALNRLPAMYATSVRGFRHLRQKAISELSRELIGTVRNGIMKVLKIPHTDLQPIAAYRFTQEYEQAILDLRTFLGRNDITLHNVVAIVQDLLLCQSASRN
ncbi:hypothetical protein B9G53_04525 [Pseudanabaena sp. SR411]|jgi:hypothetical protein|uniref:late competence development ComFB family protein n=1 Tax=Pseudanabaena sp. SR411 TaxID=1980935 RepID=UPI000B99C9D6|nr:late competence development ComFB family protein [Pseudanabaena sp. SR411]OYQ66263.1 hypothetical protein B9G53_04525 [Pseudanabaena sp. SR411]